MIKKGTNNTSHKRLTRQHPREDAHKTSHLRDLLDSVLEGTRTLLHVGDLLGNILDRTRTTLHIRVLPNSILERTRTTLHIRVLPSSILERTRTTLHMGDLLDSVLKPREAKCWRMHLSITQSPYELSITCTVLETFQFSDIVTCQLCFIAQAVILSRHQVYLCKELCVLERKFWLEFGVKGKVSHEHTIFMINMLTGIKLRKDEQQKRATCCGNIATKWLEKTTLHVLPPTFKPTLAEHEASESHARRKGQEENCKRHDFLTRWVYYCGFFWCRCSAAHRASWSVSWILRFLTM